MKKKIPNNCILRYKTDFKSKVLESDIVIWQITHEPRMLLSNIINCGLSASIGSIKGDIENIWGFKKWEKKIAIDYFENIFDNGRYFKELNNFLNYILLYRTYLKKPTILFSFFGNDFEKEAFDIIDTNYVYKINDVNKTGLIENAIDTGIILEKDSYLRLGHPSKQAQRLVAKEVKKFLTDKGLI